MGSECVDYWFTMIITLMVYIIISMSSPLVSTDNLIGSELLVIIFME